MIHQGAADGFALDLELDHPPVELVHRLRLESISILMRAAASSMRSWPCRAGSGR